MLDALRRRGLIDEDADEQQIIEALHVFLAASPSRLLGVALGTWVHPGWYGLAAFVGAGLTFAGLSNTCAMALLLARMPWNR